MLINKLRESYKTNKLDRIDDTVANAIKIVTETLEASVSSKSPPPSVTISSDYFIKPEGATIRTSTGAYGGYPITDVPVVVTRVKNHFITEGLTVDAKLRIDGHYRLTFSGWDTTKVEQTEKPITNEQEYTEVLADILSEAFGIDKEEIQWGRTTTSR